MIDVHPPHTPTPPGATSSSTSPPSSSACIIAVGLEQTVELIHHAHQRRELREALRSDTEINDAWARDDVERVDGRRHWALEQLTAVEQAGPSGPLTLRRVPWSSTFQIREYGLPRSRTARHPDRQRALVRRSGPGRRRAICRTHKLHCGVLERIDGAGSTGARTNHRLAFWRSRPLRTHSGTAAEAG